MLNCYFIYKFYDENQTLAILAETVREAKSKARAISSELVYVGYDEVEEDLFAEQKIAWICDKPVEELPFPFKQGKQLALLFAYGTNCQCCLGYRIMAGLLLGGIVGYLLG
ncbi:hypothetical protein [Lonepinella sp. BR2474]|uniref:hypothetical protein n=1 Tax=Lonepinella sp. BR2474 TaxID=3434548 RepID=UPI003F6DC43F